ncbi:MAG: hypothetical protein AAF740_07695 [Bacteroidota bacterium]
METLRVKLIGILVLIILSHLAVAQGNNQYESLNTVPEGQEFKACRIDDDGEVDLITYSGETPKYKLVRENSEDKIHTKFAGFAIMRLGKGEDYLTTRVVKPNHYTEPSIFLDGSLQPVEALGQKKVPILSKNGTGILIIDGIIYELDGNLSSGFNIETIYFPSGKSEKGEKKKMSFKEKIKAAKAALANGGIPENISQLNHRQVVEQYLKAMEDTQKKATASFSADTKAEMQYLEDAIKIYRAEVNKTNEDWWNSEEGRAVRARNEFFEKKGASDRRGEVKIINRGSKIIMIGGSVNATGGSLNPGSSSTIDCDEDVYVYRLQGTTYKRAERVSSAGSNCGGTVEVQ